MVARGPTLSVKTREFVLAARSFGAGSLRILRQHILPNITAPVLVESSLLLSEALLTEAALSFLGLGVQPPEPSWGADLGKGRQFMELGAHQVIFPGVMIMIAVFGFNLLGDGLRDYFDPPHPKAAVVPGSRLPEHQRLDVRISRLGSEMAARRWIPA